jgi:hypothetical protein
MQKQRSRRTSRLSKPSSDITVTVPASVAVPLRATIKAIWWESWTKAWGYTQAAVGFVLTGFSALYPFLSDSEFKSYISDLNLPRTIGIALAILGLITWLAHGRKHDD